MRQHGDGRIDKVPAQLLQSTQHVTSQTAPLVRRQRILRTALSGVLAKAAAFLPTLGIAPVAAAQLGSERFGVLMTVLSLMAFLNVADLGVGSNLVTAIARAFGRGRSTRVRLLQNNGLVIVVAMALLIGLGGVAIAVSGWGRAIFPRGDAALQAETTAALAVFVLMYAVSMPLTLITKIQLGMQQGHKANYWQAAGAVVNFLAGALACRLGASVPWIIAGLLSGTIVCGLLNSMTHVTSASDTGVRLRDIRRVAVRQLLAGSTSYLMLQIIFLITYAVDTLIVARHLGARDASSYAIAERLFSMVAVAVGIVTAPLWAAYGEALGNQDMAWVRQSLKSSLWRFALLAFCLCAGLVALQGPLFRLLGAGEVSVPMSLVLAMAVWRIVESLGSAVAVFLYASESLQLVLWCGALTAVVSLMAKVELVSRYGATALPLTTLCCYVLLCLLPCLRHIHKKFFLPHVER